MVYVMLFPIIKVLYVFTLRSMCVVPSMPVFFCGSVMSCFPGILRRYFLNDSEMVSVGPIVSDITFVFYILHALYFFSEIFVFLLISSNLKLIVPKLCLNTWGDSSSFAVILFFPFITDLS